MALPYGLAKAPFPTRLFLELLPAKFAQKVGRIASVALALKFYRIITSSCFYEKILLTRGWKLAHFDPGKGQSHYKFVKGDGKSIVFANVSVIRPPQFFPPEEEKDFMNNSLIPAIQTAQAEANDPSKKTVQ